MTDQRRPMTPDDLLAGMTEADSDQMDFKMNRPAKPGETFSAEGLRDFLDAINVFVTQRLTANWKRKPEGLAGPGPSTINVEVRVTLDEEFRPAAGDRMPWYMVDGIGRHTAEDQAKLYIASVLEPLDQPSRERVIRQLMKGAG